MSQFDFPGLVFELFQFRCQDNPDPRSDGLRGFCSRHYALHHFSVQGDSQCSGAYSKP